MPWLRCSAAAAALLSGSAVAHVRLGECDSKKTCTYRHEKCYAISQAAQENATALQDTGNGRCGFHCKTQKVSVDANCALPSAPYYCEDEDDWVERFTIVRYVVLGSVVLLRVRRLRARAFRSKDDDDVRAAFPLHPELAQKMRQSATSGGVGSWILAWFFGACLFVQSEGIGLAIYFATAATLDNISIFLVNPGGQYCEWVTMISLYTCALLTFLPNCFLAYYCQARMYEQGCWRSKLAFIAMMVSATCLFFTLRLQVVFEHGWAAFIESAFSFGGKGEIDFEWRQVVAAALAPPVVDLLQSLLLIAASSWKPDEAYGELSDEEQSDEEQSDEEKQDSDSEERSGEGEILQARRAQTF